jgi:transposase
MDVLHTNCAGLDVHKKTVVATVIVSQERGKPLKATQTFGTMTDDLLALSDWLMSYGVTHAPWKAQVSIGSRSTISWKRTLKSGW